MSTPANLNLQNKIKLPLIHSVDNHRASQLDNISRASTIKQHKPSHPKAITR
jgi:hypothetical protein